MKRPPDSPDAEPHTACAGNCATTADDNKKAFGIRGTAIAGSLGLALSACKGPPVRDIDRMALLYGPVGMTKDSAAGKEAPKSRKSE